MSKNVEEPIDTDEMLDDIPIVEGGMPFDSVAYKGLKIKIENVVIDKDAINFYTGPENSAGMATYNPNSTEKMWKVVVETYQLPKLDANGNPTSELLVTGQNEDGSAKTHRVKARFNLQKDKDGKWVISKSPQAKLWKFMRKQGAKTLSELKNTIVLLDTQPDRDENSDRMWLRIGI